MKFTSEQLSKVMGLKEEDVIICQGKKYIVKENKLICKDEQDGIGLDIIYGIDYLLDKDFEIIKPKKKVGDLICEDIACESCPLSNCCCTYENKSLFYNLEAWYKYNQDEEIYDILKARLDKEED